MAKLNKRKDTLILEIPRDLLLKKSSHAKKFILVDTEEYKMPILVTVYFPYSKKYFQGGERYKDKIFPRS
ncbi:hypothetical protein J7K55_06320 [Candidatus Aerophobetes bacterium]|nr:hypothetical protein [Candidatus Aerophobetes bacterium]